jgi:hypothetical protein
MSAHAYLAQLQLAPVAVRARTADSTTDALRSAALTARTAATGSSSSSATPGRCGCGRLPSG